MSGGPLHLSITTNRPQDSGQSELTQHGSERPARCPDRLGWCYFDYDSGMAYPARCGRNTCAYCVVGNARRRAAAIAYAGPEREITLTQMGKDWQTIRYRLNKVVELLRRESYTVLLDFHAEPDPNGKGDHHVHAWQKGSRIPQALLSETAQRAGAGKISHISKLRDTHAASAYGLKGLAAARYGLKGAKGDPAEYLAANGGRLSHHSRGFYLSPVGAIIGVRQAERLGMVALQGPDVEEHSWTLVRETSLASVVRVRQMAADRASGIPGAKAGRSSTAGVRPSTP